MKRFCQLLAAFLLMPLLALVTATVQEKSVRPGINKPFENPDLPDYLKKFEGESREIAANAREIVAACKLRPGMIVADVGAGTGLFTRKFAVEVGEKGKVFAVWPVLHQAAQKFGRFGVHLRHLPSLRVSPTDPAIHS